MPECPVCDAEPMISDPITLGEAPDAEEDWGE